MAQPTASFTHFLVKLFLAAPCSFFSAAAVSQLAVASFSNPNGLEAIGQNYFGDSVASGDVQLGTARAGGRPLSPRPPAPPTGLPLPPPRPVPASPIARP